MPTNFSDYGQTCPTGLGIFARALGQPYPCAWANITVALGTDTHYLGQIPPSLGASFIFVGYSGNSGNLAAIKKVLLPPSYYLVIRYLNYLAAIAAIIFKKNVTCENTVGSLYKATRISQNITFNIKLLADCLHISTKNRNFAHECEGLQHTFALDKLHTAI